MTVYVRCAADVYFKGTKYISIVKLAW